MWRACGWVVQDPLPFREGGYVCVCGERGVGELFDLDLGRLGVWVDRVWGCCVVWIGFRLLVV